MSNRFHNKFHRHNHHTTPTDRNGLYPDSAYDPIASPQFPFKGEFYVDGNITTLSSISITKDLTAINGLFGGNLTVNGDLSILGANSRFETSILATSAVEINNSGVGPALKVTQSGAQPIAHFIDSDGDDIILGNNGYLGLGTLSPSEKLTVVGNISSSGNLTANGGASIGGGVGVGGDMTIGGNITITTAPLVADTNKVLVQSGLLARTRMINPLVWDTTASFLSGRTLSANYIPAYFGPNTLVNSPISYDNSKLVITTNVSGYSLSAGSIWDAAGNSSQWNSVYATVQSISSNSVSVYSSVTSTSSNWNSVYSTVQASSGDAASKTYVKTNFFPLTGGNISGPSTFNNNVTIFGNLSCTGTQSFANTVFTTTSALSVVNIGPGPALYVGNNGTGDIASFYDIDQGVEVLHVGGHNSLFPNVGIKTSNPNKELTVNGEISSNSLIWAKTRNSDEWSSAFTYVSSNSSLVDQIFATVSANSAITWNYQGTDIKQLTANWQNTFTEFSLQSATSTSTIYAILTSVSGNWQSTFTEFSQQSANNLSVYSNLTGVSGNWQNTFTEFSQQSASNATVFTLVTSTSSTWNQQNLVGDVTSVGLSTVYSAIVPSNKGGAGLITGILRADGAGTVSAAVGGVDYVVPAALSNYATLVNLSDKITNPVSKSTGQILTYNGSSWVAESQPSIKAWVNFDGTTDTTGVTSTSATNRLIRGSSNVSSVLRNGPGDYTITFANSCVDSNYAVNFGGTSNLLTIYYTSSSDFTPVLMSESQLRILHTTSSEAYPGTPLDSKLITVTIIR